MKKLRGGLGFRLGKFDSLEGSLRVEVWGELQSWFDFKLRKIRNCGQFLNRLKWSGESKMFGPFSKRPFASRKALLVTHSLSSVSAAERVKQRG